mmetsp:Transcript_79303/g.220521  ORF Transcript_79303/g.220521 Transcript_79303/m.220521 type:complete len:350 (-) Transcript_79303:27-1076(-)
MALTPLLACFNQAAEGFQEANEGLITHQQRLSELQPSAPVDAADVILELERRHRESIASAAVLKSGCSALRTQLDAASAALETAAHQDVPYLALLRKRYDMMVVTLNAWLAAHAGSLAQVSKVEIALGLPSEDVGAGFGDGAAYWDTFYQSVENPYDWLQSYKDLRDVLQRYTHGNRELRILHVGCGNSLLSEEMYDDGYKHIVNTDISAVAIEQMRRRNMARRPCMEWVVADATSLDFEGGSFDLVLEKGVVDAMHCCAAPEGAVKRYLREVARILRDTGVFVCVSFGASEERARYFEESPLGADLETTEVSAAYASRGHFVYACWKGRSSPRNMPKQSEGTAGGQDS